MGRGPEPETWLGCAQRDLDEEFADDRAAGAFGPTGRDGGFVKVRITVSGTLAVMESVHDDTAAPGRRAAPGRN